MTRRSCPAETVTRVVGKWLELEDDLLPVVPLVVAVANCLSGPPVWLMIVAPPASGKSEMIMGLGSIKGVHPISKVTPQTFASGMQGRGDGDRPRSLLERLRESGKWLLTLKDFGTLSSLMPLQRNAIFGQLREIYDGRFNAQYGTGVEVDWFGKLGMVVGATPVVDRQQKWSAELGERFVQFRPAAPAPEKVAQRAVRAAAHEKQRQAQITLAYAIAFSDAMALARGQESGYTKVTLDIEQQASALALFLAEARRPVRRDRFTRAFQVLPPEGPGRLVKVLVQIQVAAVVCYGGDREAATRLTARVAVDSVPGRRGRLLRELARSSDGVAVKPMARLLECDDNTAREELDDLVAIGLATSVTPAKTMVYKASARLLTRAGAVFPDLEPAQALRKLFDLPTNITPEGERGEEEEGDDSGSPVLVVGQSEGFARAATGE